MKWSHCAEFPPYSRTLFKHDGTGEVKGTTKPGDTFKDGSPYLTTSENEMVSEDDVYLDNYLNIRATNLSLPRPLVIKDEFLKTTVTDESGKQAVTYTDKAGKTIISLFLSNPIIKSYQFYDNAGRLTVSISPNGLNQLAANVNFKDIDKTRYYYNSKGLLAATEEKDAGRTEYIYRKDGKIRFSQNADQRKDTLEHKPRYSYTNYDMVGRPVESGEYVPITGTQESEGIVFGTQAMKAILEVTAIGGGLSETKGTKQERSFSYYDEPNSTLRTQRFVNGAVSYTKKDNVITTWYSYDELGRVEWMIQDIANFGIKTIDYRYGPTGQVQDVTYQKGKDDQFVHYYEYDKDARLSKVYTSRLELVYNKKGKLENPGILELQATYSYYLHGPLKRVELANKLQGIDYVYTVDGKLKSINHADPTKDPGKDGTNGVQPDVFGITLDYFTGDYVGADYNAGSITGLNAQTYKDQYSGLIKATRWHGPVEPGKQFSYAYQYDDRNQFTQADWGSVTGNTFDPTLLHPYKEAVGSYDANGNIRNLQRNATRNVLSSDNENISIADFKYNYKTNTNQLQSITKPNSTETLRAYDYNAIGQMTKETVGDSSKFIEYNVSGKVTAVYADESRTRPITNFIYDDRGFRLAKITYDTNYVPVQRTWYVRDASGNMISTYEDDLTNVDPAKPTEVPVYGSGKIGLYKPTYGITFYEVTDHLGNVRAVVGDTLTIISTATMESGEAHDREQAQGFMNLRSSGPAILNKTQGGDEIYRLDNQPNEANNFTKNPMGVGKLVWVHPGDTIDLDVFAGYESFSQGSNQFPLTSLATFLASAFTGPGTVIDGVSIFQAMNDPEAIAAVAAASGSNGKPGVFLNYILFDKDFKFVDFDNEPVSEAAEINATNQSLEHIFINDITIEKEGFMYVYVSSMTDQGMVAYFDDLTITQHLSNIVAGGDFYPYGLAIKDRQIDRKQYRFGYQGQFAEKDDETGWNHFELREYDPIIGRWTTFDPKKQYWSPYKAMSNNPISAIDPNGGFSPPTDFVNTATGESKHVEDGSNNVVSIEPEKWNEFLKMYDAMQYVSNKTAVTYDLLKYGSMLYDVDGMLFIRQLHNGTKEWGMNVFVEGKNAYINPNRDDDNVGTYNHVDIYKSWNAKENGWDKRQKAVVHFHYSSLDTESPSSEDLDIHHGNGIYNIEISNTRIYFYNKGKDVPNRIGNFKWQKSGENFSVPIR